MIFYCIYGRIKRKHLEDKNLNRRGRNGLLVIAGGYLVYTGFNLIKDILEKSPENSVLFIGAGAIFMIIGVLTVIHYAKAMMKADKEEKAALEDSEGEEEPAEVTGEAEATKEIEAAEAIDEELTKEDNE